MALLLPAVPETSDVAMVRAAFHARERVILSQLREVVDCLNGLSTPYEAKQRALGIVMALMQKGA